MVVLVHSPKQIRGYAICTTPRSGSNYACEILSSTGALGFPREYFNTKGMKGLGIESYSNDPDTQVSHILTDGLSNNGVYGVKVMSPYFDYGRRTLWVDRLPNLKLLYLERRDYLGQAISWVKASQTGIYRSNDKEIENLLFYDAVAIRKQLETIARNNARWRIFFARNNLSPIWFTYEDILANPDKLVEVVAGLMGERVPNGIKHTNISLEIQRDARTEEWRARFLAESRDITHLDAFDSDTFWAWLRNRTKWARRLT